MASTARTPRTGSGYIDRSRSAGLADILDILLDKGLVIDIFLRVSLVGIELLTVDARIVIASVDTYLRFAEAVNRLDIGNSSDSEGLPELMEDITSGGASSKTQGVLEGAKESLFGSDDDEDEQENGSSSGSGSRSRAASSRSGSGSRSASGSRSGSGSRSRARSGSGGSSGSSGSGSSRGR